MDVLDDNALFLVGVIYNIVHVLAPVVVILACYLSMMFAVSVPNIPKIQTHARFSLMLHFSTY